MARAALARVGFSRACIGGGRMKQLILGCLLYAAAVWGGCASSSNLTTRTSTLSSATDALITTETSFYDQLIAISAARQKSSFDRAFVLHQEAPDAVIKRYKATPPEGYEKAKAVRLKLLQELSAYAHQIDAMASGAQTAWPSSQATAVATDTGALVTRLYGGTVPTAATTAVQIVNSIASDIVQSQTATEASTLAASAQPEIQKVQEVIESDNEIVNAGIPELINQQKDDEAAIVQQVYPNAGSTAIDRIRTLQTLTGFLPVSVTLANTQSALSDAMSKVVGANKALADKKSQSAGDLLNEAVAVLKTAAPATSSSTSANASK